MSVDLEEKLRELRANWWARNYVSFDDCLPVLREAAALGRAEAIEEAAKVCENVIGVPESKIRAYLAESIRALKEKG